MRPLALEMEGFGAFREACRIDLRDIELVALVGATGSGKSTIIDAITFALYGSVARYDDNRAVAPIINQTSTRARVRLDFELGGERYSAVRLVMRTKTGATTKEARLVRGEDEDLAADASSMSAEVARLLGLDVDQFNRTVVLPQGRFADFLHDNPAARQKTLRQLLGLQVYERIGNAARTRAAALRNQVSALQPDLDEGERTTTDDVRAALVARHELVATTRRAYIEALERIDATATEVATLEERLAGIAAHLALVHDVRKPDHLADLDRRVATAEADVALASDVLTAARVHRRDADAAAAAGPDLATSTTALRRRHEATAALADHRLAAEALARAERDRDAAQRAAEVVAAQQATLDELVSHARTAEQSARRSLDEGPNPTQLANWIERGTQRASLRADATAATTAAADATAAVELLAARAATAGATETAARRQRDELQQRAGAVGFAGLLHTGAPCPLCLQVVGELPEHHVDEELHAAQRSATIAAGESAAAAKELQEAERRAADLAAHAHALGRSLGALDAELDGVPEEHELRARAAEAAQLRAALDAATARSADAERAAVEHRSDPSNVERVRVAQAATIDVAQHQALADSRRDRSDALQADVVDILPEDVLEAAIAEANALAAERASATAEHESAENALETARSRRAAIARELQTATTELHATRDRLVALAPPAVVGDRLAADWSALIAWAAARRSTLTAERTSLAAGRDEAAELVASTERAERARCQAVLGTAAGDLHDLRDQLTGAETSAAAAIAAFDTERTRLATLRGRIDTLTSDGDVATMLGHLLRAPGFEAWLMRAALEELVDSASVRLRELSSGQFSLELDERELMVRDHASADEVRGVRTLSGGETFLASLALALALADATTELSPEGTPAIESIFLDEGFGTLDPDTLDVVAAAIEELGSRGRMVAVVTHIRELADRMPVRLEVTKNGSTSTVERVDT